MSETIINVKCDGCFLKMVVTIEGVMTEQEIEADSSTISPCINCGRELEIDHIYLNDNNEYDVETSVNWEEIGEYWLPADDTFEGLTKYDDQGIDNDEYEKLSQEEKDNYNVCTNCDNAFEKNTGLCREYQHEGIWKCKDCHTHI